MKHLNGFEGYPNYKDYNGIFNAYVKECKRAEKRFEKKEITLDELAVDLEYAWIKATNIAEDMAYKQIYKDE